MAEAQKNVEKQLHQQAAQNALLQQKLLEAQEQIAALQPPTASNVALQEPVTLPPPALPASSEAQAALRSLGHSLRLLAQQEEAVTVTWGDLARAKMHWQDFLLLVPIQVAIGSLQVVKCGTGAAPDLALAVPRKLLELLRSQLDAMEVQMTVAQQDASQKQQLATEAQTWAASVLDQAKRIAERKRIPAPDSAGERDKKAAAAAKAAAAVPVNGEGESI